MAAAAGEQTAATGLVPSVLGVQRASAETSLRGEDRYVRRLCPCQGSMRVELVSGARVFDRVIETTQRDKLRMAEGELSQLCAALG